MVLVPPEVIELEAFSTDAGEAALVTKEEWPEYLLRLFDNDVSSVSHAEIIVINIAFRYPQTPIPHKDMLSGPP